MPEGAVIQNISCSCDVSPVVDALNVVNETLLISRNEIYLIVIIFLFSVLVGLELVK